MIRFFFLLVGVHDAAAMIGDPSGSGDDAGTHSLGGGSVNSPGPRPGPEIKDFNVVFEEAKDGEVRLKVTNNRLGSNEIDHVILYKEIGGPLQSEVYVISNDGDPKDFLSPLVPGGDAPEDELNKNQKDIVGVVGSVLAVCSANAAKLSDDSHVVKLLKNLQILMKHIALALAIGGTPKDVKGKYWNSYLTVPEPEGGVGIKESGLKLGQIAHHYGMSKFLEKPSQEKELFWMDRNNWEGHHLTLENSLGKRLWSFSMPWSRAFVLARHPIEVPKNEIDPRLHEKLVYSSPEHDNVEYTTEDTARLVTFARKVRCDNDKIVNPLGLQFLQYTQSTHIERMELVAKHFHAMGLISSGDRDIWMSLLDISSNNLQTQELRVHALSNEDSKFYHELLKADVMCVKEFKGVGSVMLPTYFYSEVKPSIDPPTGSPAALRVLANEHGGKFPVPPRGHVPKGGGPMSSLLPYDEELFVYPEYIWDAYGVGIDTVFKRSNLKGKPTNAKVNVGEFHDIYDIYVNKFGIALEKAVSPGVTYAAGLSEVEVVRSLESVAPGEEAYRYPPPMTFEQVCSSATPLTDGFEDKEEFLLRNAYGKPLKFGTYEDLIEALDNVAENGEIFVEGEERLAFDVYGRIVRISQDKDEQVIATVISTPRTEEPALQDSLADDV